jgi:hypothetical protein
MSMPVTVDLKVARAIYFECSPCVALILPLELTDTRCIPHDFNQCATGREKREEGGKKRVKDEG